MSDAHDMTCEEARAALVAFMAERGLTVESTFVPFSQSRNKDEPHPSLNWKVTLQRKGRPVLTCDYQAGAAYCPGYNAPMGEALGFEARRYRRRDGTLRSATDAEKLKQYRDAVTRAECESGVLMRLDQWATHVSVNTFKPGPKGAPIMPDPVDVFASLVRDSDVLESGGFESWAADCGYDVDSRKAEAIFRLCVEHALALAGAIGHADLARARDLARQL